MKNQSRSMLVYHFIRSVVDAIGDTFGGALTAGRLDNNR